jgi:hypothetical protein
MPVSYLSQPVKPNPYVLPVDLDLMGKVLQYKDQQYQQHKEQIQQTVNNFAGLDVMKPEDRQYLNTKINSLVQNINNNGNADLSDPNTVTQLQGFGSTISGDPKIMNAVAGTHMVRQLQQQYNEFKTNPKMKGMYGASNFAKDMNSVQKWMADGEVGSNYNGPSTATPYMDVDKKASEIAKDIKASEFSYDTKNGLYIERTTGQSKTEDQIQQIVAQRLMNDPNYSQQVQTNAWYLTEGSGIQGKDIIQHNSQLLQGQIDDLDSNIVKNKELLTQASNDPANSKTYSDRINALSISKNKLQQQKGDLDKNGLKNYEDNPTGYQTNYYLNNLTSGLAATYAFRNEKHELRPDQATMFQYKYDQAERGLELRAAEKGFGWDLDPTTGKRTLVFHGIPGQAGNTPGNGIINSGIAAPNRVSDTDSLEKNAEKTSTDIATLEGQKKNFLVNSINDAIRSDPNLKFLRDDSGKIAGQDFLTGTGRSNTAALANQYFDVSDLEPQNLQAAVSRKKITPQQAKWYGSLYQAYQDKAEGKPVDISQFPEGFEQGFDNINEINNEIQFKKNQLGEANQYLTSAANLTPQETALLTDYQINPLKYQHYSESQSYRNLVGDVYGSNAPGASSIVLDSRIQRIKDKMDNMPSDIKKAYWDNVSRRVQYPYGVDTFKDKKGEFLMAPALKEAHDAGNIIGDKATDVFTPEDIKAIGYERNADPATSDQYPYIADVTITSPGENGKKSDKIERIGLNPILAQQRGLTVGNRKIQNITEEVMQSPDGSMPRIVNNPQTGFSVKVIVTKLNNDPNDSRSQARVLVPNAAQGSGYNYVKLGPPLGSPGEAYGFAENFISSYTGTDFDKFTQEANDFNSTRRY